MNSPRLNVDIDCVDKGNYAITKIISIKDDTRGSDHDELTCNYIVID